MLVIHFCGVFVVQALSKLGYNPYISTIVPTESYTSSSDEESYLQSRRKKSCTTGGENTPRHKGVCGGGHARHSGVGVGAGGHLRHRCVRACGGGLVGAWSHPKMGAIKVQHFLGVLKVLIYTFNNDCSV